MLSINCNLDDEPAFSKEKTEKAKPKPSPRIERDKAQQPATKPRQREVQSEEESEEEDEEVEEEEVEEEEVEEEEEEIEDEDEDEEVEEEEESLEEDEQFSVWFSSFRKTNNGIFILAVNSINQYWSHSWCSINTSIMSLYPLSVGQYNHIVKGKTKFKILTLLIL